MASGRNEARVSGGVPPPAEEFFLHFEGPNAVLLARNSPDPRPTADGSASGELRPTTHTMLLLLPARAQRLLLSVCLNTVDFARAMARELCDRVRQQAHRALLRIFQMR